MGAPVSDVRLVYYIGAGASAKSLPTAADIPSRMRKLANALSTGNYEPDSQYKHLLGRLCDEMKSLATRAAAYPSIDVLARILHLQGKDAELRKLKATLSTYLLLEQSNKPSDPRYGSFFAYLADKDANGTLAMPTDLRIVSWNYDMQFEKSFAEFIPDHLYEKKSDVGRMLQIVPTGVESRDHYDGIFSIYKLNGAAGVRDPSDRGHFHNNRMMIKSYDVVIFGQTDKFDCSSLNLALHFYEKVMGNDDPYLQFAWEDDNRRASVLELIDQFSPVEIVVVIGYSFPLFNRELDRKVFELLGPRKVFLQVAAGDEAVKDRLGGLGVDSEIVRVVRDEDQYYIPPAYSPSAWLSRESRAERDLTCPRSSGMRTLRPTAYWPPATST